MAVIRFAVIGTSTITRKFLAVATEVPSLQFVGAYSRSMEWARAFGAEYGAPLAFDSLDVLAGDERVDAVYIASPNACHSAQAVRLLRAGKHVLCEKPAASNRREWDAMEAAARESGAVLLEAMRSVFAPGFARLRELLPRLGVIRQASFVFCQYSSRYDNFKRGIVENAFRPELSNGALMDIGVYCVYPMAALFGLPAQVTADAVFLENGVDGAGSALASYTDKQVLLRYSKINDDAGESVICGEEGCLRIDRIQDIRRLTFCPRGGTPEVIDVPTAENNMVYEAQRFAGLIEAAAPCEPYMTWSRSSMTVLDRIRRQAGIVFPADNA